MKIRGDYSDSLGIVHDMVIDKNLMDNYGRKLTYKKYLLVTVNTS